MARDEAHIEQVAADLAAHGVTFHRVVEDTPPYVGKTMALGLPPAAGKETSRRLSSLPLLR